MRSHKPVFFICLFSFCCNNIGFLAATSEEWGSGGIPRRRSLNLAIRPKVWTRSQRCKKQYQKWRAREAHMRKNTEGGELLDPAVDDSRRFKKNSLSIYPEEIKGRLQPWQRSRESSQRSRLGSAFLEETEEIWQKRKLQKDFVTR